MKKYILILMTALLALVSCNKWLDIQPANTINEDDLFNTGDGYRIALNGIYLKLASSSLYGRELTYGMTEALAHTHEPDRAYKNNLVYKDMSNYEYTSDAAKGIISGIWTTAYYIIANCNNLIEHIEKDTPDKFALGEREMNLIHGEALAVRALCHFIILQYFAPAPEYDKPDETGKYGKPLPYYDKFSKEIAEYLDPPSFVNRIVEDFKAAREKVAVYDLADNLNRYRLSAKYRFSGSTSNSAYPQPSDIFFAFRGYRMNYYAISAFLAKVYAYNGQYREAQKEADLVLKATTQPEGAGERLFSLTPIESIPSDYKLSNDLIFGLSSSTLVDDYSRFRNAGTTLVLNDSYSSIISASTTDHRWKSLVGGSSGNYVCNRYTAASQLTSDILPVIRLSEMYYIYSEYYADATLYADAGEYIEIVKEGRGGPENQLYGKIVSRETFYEELLKDARIEFIEEGQVFFYCKKANIFPDKWDKGSSSLFSSAKWYFDLPDSEYAVN